MLQTHTSDNGGQEVFLSLSPKARQQLERPRGGGGGDRVREVGTGCIRRGTTFARRRAYDDNASVNEVLVPLILQPFGNY